LANTPDGGEEVAMILNNVPVILSLPSTGTTIQKRFLLDNKEPLTLSATVRTGSVIMYVSLVPATTQKALWKVETQAGKTGKISVKTSDANFHFGALYYIILTSTSGRVDMTLGLSQARQVTEL
jgi:hypothetical protein